MNPLIPIIDLKRQTLALQPELEEAVRRVLEGGHYVLGETLERFEAEMAAYCGVKHAIGVNSGTDAIYLALLALGVGPGDDVVTTAFSMFATVEPIRWVGARPVFVDIDPATYQLDVSQLRSKVTRKVKAIIPVHLYGGMVDMEAVMAIAAERKVAVIEDAAQALGAAFQGRKAGSWGDLGCVSFYPTKNLGAAGDGGMVLTNHDHLAEAVRALRHHGQKKKYVHESVGINSRLDDLQAAVLSVKLKRLDGWNARRRAIAAHYTAALKDSLVMPPVEPAGVFHIYHQYTVRTPDRARFQQRLAEAGVATAIHYPIPLPLQPALVELGHQKGDFPESERAAGEVLSLPVFPELTDSEVERMTHVLRAATAVPAGR